MLVEGLCAGVVRGCQRAAGEGQSSQGMVAVTQPCSFIPGEDVMLGCHHLLQCAQLPGNCFPVQFPPSLALWWLMVGFIYILFQWCCRSSDCLPCGSERLPPLSGHPSGYSRERLQYCCCPIQAGGDGCSTSYRQVPLVSLLPGGGRKRRVGRGGMVQNQAES